MTLLHIAQPITPEQAADRHAYEREMVAGYGSALARERAAWASVEAWRALRGRLASRLASMPADSAARLRAVLAAGEADALAGFQVAAADLRDTASPFTIAVGGLARVADACA